MYPSTAWNKHFLPAMYFSCYNNYMIEENDNYKVMFDFLSPNVLLLFVFKIASWNVFFFLRKFCVVYLIIKRWHKKNLFHLSLNYWKWNLFLANKGSLLLKLKHVRNVVVVIILVVIVCTFFWTNIFTAMSGAGFHNPLHSPTHMCCGDVTLKVIWFD